MPYADLSFVTSTLEGVLADNPGSFDPALSYDTTNRAPNEITAGDKAVVSLYLHHASQSGFHSNLTGPGGASEPSANPLALSLFYVVTVHRNVPPNDPDRYERERIFGHVVKTFHDNPVVRVERPPGAPPGPDISDQIEIAQRPVTPELANTFWSNSGWQTGARLSAFYEVRVVLLEPEPPRRIPAPVLTVTSSVAPMRIPHIDGTENQLTIDVPDSAAVELTPRPAQLSLDVGAAPLLLRGSSLFGARTFAWIIPPGNLAPFELPVTAASPELAGIDVPPDPGGQELISGFYQVQLRHRADTPALTLVAESNKAVFSIVPTLTGISTSTPGLVAELSVVPAPPPDADIAISVGGQVLELRPDTSDTTPAPGSPGVANRDGASGFVVTMSAPVPVPLPVGLTVDGIASRPEWLFR